jgi:hypothetical protein
VKIVSARKNPEKRREKFLRDGRAEIFPQKMKTVGRSERREESTRTVTASWVQSWILRSGGQTTTSNAT